MPSKLMTHALAPQPMIVVLVRHGLQVLIAEVNHHHFLVECLHGETEMQVVDAAVLLEVLEERINELGILQ